MPLIEEQYAAHGLLVLQIFVGEVQRKEKAKADVLRRICRCSGIMFKEMSENANSYRWGALMSYQ